MARAVCYHHAESRPVVFLAAVLALLVIQQASGADDLAVTYGEGGAFDVAWRSSTTQRTYWGTANSTSWEAAAASCKKKGGKLLSIKDSKEQATAMSILESVWWVGLTTNTTDGEPHWVGGSRFLPFTSPNSVNGFNPKGASPARTPEPWCASVRYPSLYTAAVSLAAANCSMRAPFICSFWNVSDPTPLKLLGKVYSISNNAVLAVNSTYLTWGEAKDWCDAKGGKLLDLGDPRLLNIPLTSLLTSLGGFDLPSAVYPTRPAASSVGNSPDSHMGLWLGLGAMSCRALSGGQGGECTWQGDAEPTILGPVLPTGQNTDIVKFKETCTVLDPTDMQWVTDISCVDSRFGVCQAEHRTWTGAHSVYESYQYSFFTRPASRALAASICSKWDATLLPLGNSTEEAWVTSMATKYTRNQPLLAAPPPGAAAAGCWTLGQWHVNDTSVFEAGVQAYTTANCGTMSGAFVCRKAATSEQIKQYYDSLKPVSSPSPQQGSGTGTTGTTPSSSPSSTPSSTATSAIPSLTRSKPTSSSSPSPLIIFAITAGSAVFLAALLTTIGLYICRKRVPPPTTPPLSKDKINPIFHPLDSTETNTASNPIPRGQDVPPSIHSSHTSDSFPYDPNSSNNNTANTHSTATHNTNSTEHTNSTHNTNSTEHTHSSHPHHSNQSNLDSSSSSHVLHVILDSNPEKQLKVFRDHKLGHGAFGAVYKGEYMGVPVAVKTLDVLSMSGLTSTLSGSHSSDSSGCSAEVAAIRQELSILSRVQHPNVVKLYGGCLTPPNVLIVMELMEYSLGEYIRRAKRRLPLKTTLQVIRAVAAGLTHLHPNIIHRDLKPQNILLDSSGNVKISDFGVSRVKLATYLTTQHQAAGTIPYMAPECYSSEAVTEKFDIYSLGIILWECVSGRPPWEGWNGMAIMYHVGCLKVRPPIPEDPELCPPDVAALISRCWAHDPHERPSAEQIVEEINRIEAVLPE